MPSDKTPIAVGKLYKLVQSWTFFEVESFEEILRLSGGEYEQPMIHLGVADEQGQHFLYLGHHTSPVQNNLVPDRVDYFLWRGRVIVTIDWPVGAWYDGVFKLAEVG